MNEKAACDKVMEIVGDSLDLFDTMKHRMHRLRDKMCAKAYQMDRDGKLNCCVDFIRRVKDGLDDSDGLDETPDQDGPNGPNGPHDSDDLEDGPGCPVPR